MAKRERIKNIEKMIIKGCRSRAGREYLPRAGMQEMEFTGSVISVK